MTRETLVALTTNVKSREQRRSYIVNNGLPQEHPRASMTDDMECFFSAIRDTVGKHFTYKDVQYTWRKCCIFLIFKECVQSLMRSKRQSRILTINALEGTSVLLALAVVLPCQCQVLGQFE